MAKLFTKIITIFTTSFITLLITSPESVRAASFNFTQTGFSGGGNLRGSFQGEDTNNDGSIVNNELTSFNLEFIGDRIVETFDANTSKFNARRLFNYNIANNSFNEFQIFDVLTDRDRLNVPGTSPGRAAIGNFNTVLENGVTTITRSTNVTQISTSGNPFVISTNNPSVKVDEPEMFYGLTFIGILGLGIASQKRKLTT
jgi:hypothetical protein